MSFLLRTGMLPYDAALDLTKYFNKEQNYAPWYTLMESLGYISSMLEGRPGYSVYEVSRLTFLSLSFTSFVLDKYFLSLSWRHKEVCCL